MFGRITFFAVDSTLFRSRDSFSWNPCKAALITKSVSRTPRHQNTTRANRQVRLPPNMLPSHIAIQGGQASLSQNPLPSTLPPPIPHGPNREKTLKTRSNNARGLSRQQQQTIHFNMARLCLASGQARRDRTWGDYPGRSVEFCWYFRGLLGMITNN